MSRLIEVSGASDNARTVMRMMCLSTDRTADWGIYSEGLSASGAAPKVGMSACVS